VKQLKNDVTLVLENLCGILNFDFAPENAPVKVDQYYHLYIYLEAEGLNNRGGFPKAAAIVNGVKELLDPIIRAHMAKKPAIELEETLANEVNRTGGISWQLERTHRERTEGRRRRFEQTARWEGRYRRRPGTLKEFLLVEAGALLLRNAMDKLRRCRNCGRYIMHTAGQMRDFCNMQCRNKINNGANRVRKGVLQLARFARMNDYDLTPSNRKKINQWLGDEAFQAMRPTLKAITLVNVQEFIEELPEVIRTRLATARQAKQKASRGGKKQARKVTGRRQRRKR
jgi:hypothetical protein